MIFLYFVPLNQSLEPACFADLGPGSLHVDLQQRSCEFLEILGADWESHRAGILDRMPVPEKDVPRLGSMGTGR